MDYMPVCLSQLLDIYFKDFIIESKVFLLYFINRCFSLFIDQKLFYISLIYRIKCKNYIFLEYRYVRKSIKSILYNICYYIVLYTYISKKYNFRTLFYVEEILIKTFDLNFAFAFSGTPKIKFYI